MHTESLRYNKRHVKTMKEILHVYSITSEEVNDCFPIALFFKFCEISMNCFWFILSLG